ncbi:prolipoprotein diacylglyceryl transferase [Actinokineospora cianjurensis]|uniref:Phosphatidylglycerol--prolipoprotein diacylglyceryl transferase n=1 Tax=Actinokineospora cianjurensis TaxID=585224 RepID=A0A421BD20_9PSEU|nr:prolipoprotein diacylglyceryl transferase [Actinokineospora cianjurensis]RLK62269.1 prolipoprotein diacylglyceryl transferase [Actinokineospora cianjurensis]
MTSASTVFLASIPSPDRGVWELDLGVFTLPLRAYALCIIAGIIVAIYWGEKRFVARGGQPGTVLDVAVYAVPFGLVGGRLYHVATDYYRYFGEGKNPLNALRIWDGGLGIWGAIALGAVGAWIGCRRKGVPLPVFADAIAPGIITAQAIGRIGNYFNQELYGGPTDLPWGLEIYRRVNEFGQEDPLNGVAIDHTLIDGSPVHPTFLYELVWNLLIAVVVVLLDRKLRLGHGRAFAIYVAGYTVGRGLIEMMRTDPATMVLGLRINVWTSILLLLGALVYFVLAAKRGPREDLAALTPATDPPTESDESEDESDESDTDDESTADDEDEDDADDKPAKEKTPARGPAESTEDGGTPTADGGDTPAKA